MYANVFLVFFSVFSKSADHCESIFDEINKNTLAFASRILICHCKLSKVLTGCCDFAII